MHLHDLLLSVWQKKEDNATCVHVMMVSPSQTSITLSLGWHVSSVIWQLITFVSEPKQFTLMAPPLPLGPLMSNVSELVENQLDTPAKPNSEQATVAASLLHVEAQGAIHSPLNHTSNCPTLGWGPPSNRRSPPENNRKMTQWMHHIHNWMYSKYLQYNSHLEAADKVLRVKTLGMYLSTVV